MKKTFFALVLLGCIIISTPLSVTAQTTSVQEKLALIKKLTEQVVELQKLLIMIKQTGVNPSVYNTPIAAPKIDDDYIKVNTALDSTKESVTFDDGTLFLPSRGNQIIKGDSSGIKSFNINIIQNRKLVYTEIVKPLTYFWSATIDTTIKPGSYDITITSMDKRELARSTLIVGSSIHAGLLKKDKKFDEKYSIGEEITLSWSSESAAYAVWETNYPEGNGLLGLTDKKLPPNGKQTIKISGKPVMRDDGSQVIEIGLRFYGSKNDSGYKIVRDYISIETKGTTLGQLKSEVASIPSFKSALDTCIKSTFGVRASSITDKYQLTSTELETVQKCVKGTYSNDGDYGGEAQITPGGEWCKVVKGKIDPTQCHN